MQEVNIAHDMTPGPPEILRVKQHPLVWPIALLYPLLFTLISLSWFFRAPYGWQYSGFMQGDQPTYTAWAREVFEGGNGFVYANPFDADPKAPRVFSNLNYLILAWTEKILPINWAATWELLRIVGGFLTALLLFKIFKLFELSHRQTFFLWLLALTGGGVAWILALPGLFQGQWLERFMFIEDGRGTGVGYGWWLPNLFRQPLYPLETLYHAMFYGTALAYLSKRQFLCLLLLTLLWWMHPITAALVTTVLGLSVIGEFLAGRERTKQISLLAGIGLIGMAFVFYNRIFLASFPPVASFVEQTLSMASERLTLQWAFEAWGLVLVLALGALLLPRVRRFLVKEPVGRFVLAWLVAVLFWTNQPIQPMHFTRGHVWVALVWVAAIFVREYGNILKYVNTRIWLCLAWAGVVFFLMDNVLFLVRVAVTPPRPYQLMISPSQDDILSFLEESPPSTIHSLDPFLAGQIASRTPHRIFIGDRAATPFHDEKVAMAQELLASGNAEFIQRFGIDYMVIPQGLFPQIPANQVFGNVVKENADYVVVPVSKGLAKSSEETVAQRP